MNKKNKYIRPLSKTRIDVFDLFLLTHPMDNEGERLRHLWDIHGAAITEAWKAAFPATRPRLFWLLEHRDSYDKLCKIEQARIDKSETPALKASLDLKDAKAELIRLGLLDDDEMGAEPKEFCFSKFCRQYQSGR